MNNAKEVLLDLYISRELKSLNGIQTLTKESIKNVKLSLFSKKYMLSLPQPVVENNEFESVMYDCCSLLFDYTLKPCEALTGYIFREMDSQQSLAALKKISIFGFYKYYPETISSYLKHENKVIFTRNELAELLDETNAALHEKLVNKITSVKIKNLFSQIFNLKYFSQDKVNLESVIPFEFASGFLNDKNFSDLEEMLVLIPDHNSGEVSMKELIKALTGKYSKPVVISQTESANETPDVITVYDSDEISKNGVELIVKDTEEDKTLAKEKVVLDLADKSNELYSTELVTANEVQAKDEYPTEIIEETGFNFGKNELRKLFRPYELKEICNKVFGREKNKMYEFFGEIELINDWNSVSERLKDLFIENKVNPYDRNVLLFVDVLQDHFSKKD